MQRKHHRSSTLPSGNKQRSLDAQWTGDAMKRTTRKSPSDTSKQPTVDRAWLSAVRGGVDIAARIAGPPATWIPSQHNELLVRV